MQGSKLKKVCYIAPDVPIPFPSGASVHVREVASGLSKLGHEVHVVARRVSPDESKEEEIEGFMVHRVYRQVVRPGRKQGAATQGVKGNTILGEAYYFYLRTFFALYVACVASRIISKYNLDVIIERESAFGAGGLASVFSGRAMLLEIIGPRYSRLSVRRSSRILYYTDSMLRGWVDRKKCVKVTAGVNLALFGEDRSLGSITRQKLNVKDDVTLVGYVGTFQRWHGIDILLQAGSSLSPRYPGLRFLLVGPSYQPYESLAAELQISGICIFTGPVDYSQTPAYINACQILVAPYNPSADELREQYGIGFPLKILEYMACGKAVIASDVPPIDELVSSRDVGLLVPPNDARSLASGLSELMNNPEETARLGSNGKRLVESQYGWSRFAELISSYVQSI